MNKFVFASLLMMGCCCSGLAFAETSTNSSSMMFNQNYQAETFETPRSSVNFFDHTQKKELERQQQKHANAVKMHQDATRTNHMSSYEKSQYFMQNSDTNTLHNFDHQQQQNGLDKAKKRGSITNAEYQRQKQKINPFPSHGQTTQPLISIPLGN